MTDLNKIKLGYSPLSDSIFLYRHGKDEKLALDKREAGKDVMAVLVEYMMHDTDKGSVQKVSFKPGEWYEIRVKRIDSTNDAIKAREDGDDTTDN